MPFIDNLALTEALLLFAAAVMTYMGVTTWWAMVQNRPDKVRSALRGAALPLGAVGVTSVTLGLWAEMVWPYGLSMPMASYNIFFNDATLMLGIVLVAFAAAAYLHLRLQYVGVLAFMAGVAVLLYGWSGYGLGMTKDPFETFLLYAGFGVAGIVALPATIVTDHYLANVAESPTSWRTSVPATSRLARFGTRAVQSLGGGPRSGGGESGSGGTGGVLRYRIPTYVHIVLLLFPVFMLLAGVAAWGYLGTTVPHHLQSAP